MRHQLFIVWLILPFMLAACNGSQQESSSPDLPSEIKAGAGEQQASGYVFHDANENEKKDEGEAGIEGVAVSNGRDVVVTNEDGYYGLPVSDDAAIFVIKPKNWMTPVNEVNLPQHYYLHKPNGYPSGYRYKGVAPTGDLPEQINFPLYKQKEEREFKILVFGDPQPYSIQEVDYLAEDIVSELIDRKDVEFGMTMGDIVGDSLNYFRPMNETVAQIGIPWYNVMGNHDINYQAPTDKLSDETFERVYGPSTYAFAYGDVHFIILDDVIHENKAGSREYVGGLREDQLTFMKNYLRTVPRQDLVVLNMHIPVYKEGDGFRESDREQLFEMLSEFPHTLSISAHTHVQNNWFFHRDSSQWQRSEPHHHYNMGTTSGTWWNGLRGENNIPHTMMRDGTPNGYAFITFKDNEYTIDWKVAGSSPDHRMNIHVPRGIQAGSNDNPLLTVNFFNGSSQSKVEYRIKGHTGWKEMNKVEKFDPYYHKLHQRWNFLKEAGTLKAMRSSDTDPQFSISDWDLSHPQPSSHLWEANLGTDWPAGSHTIDVRVEDRYGRTFKDHQLMRVKQPQ